MTKANAPAKTFEISTSDLVEVWGTIGQDASSTYVRDDGTIVPRRGSNEQLLKLIHEKLPRLGVAGNCVGPPDLSLGDVIGEGAMGVVKIARQVPVDREVAIKAVRPEALKFNAPAELLREAWITGRLEHPNIVPIYTIGRDADDLPIMVMKRIEGVTWSELIHDNQHRVMRSSGRDRLAFHLGKLIQVSNAVHYAHSKGILHRDLKPENVMIGAFGEVYVLDWGIAVSLRDDPYLPMARDVTTVAGTPDYMAPEMTTGDGSLLCPETDVFLLGAVLHEIVTGEPRHRGESLFDKIFAAARPKPYDYGPEVPDELVAILNKSLAYDPEERYRTADDFRQAIQEFLSHRESRELASEAQARFEAMCYLLGDGEHELASEEEAQLNNLFGEARFGFKQALRAWPENPIASRGYQTALETMAEYELRRGARSAAAGLIADLPEKRPDLERRLAELEAQQEVEGQEIARLKTIEKALDGSTGTGAPAVLMMFVIFAWGAGYLVASILERLHAYDARHPEFAILSGAIFGVLVLALPFIRRRLRHRGARRLFASTLVLAGAMGVQWLTAWLLGTDLRSTQLNTMVLTSAVLGASAFAADSRLIMPALSFLAAYVIVLTEPSWVLEAYAGASFASLVSMAITWRPKVVVDDPDAIPFS